MTPVPDTLRAYTDDSGSDIGDRPLFLAGYLNSIENWELFDRLWQEQLLSAPAIRYLKMTEAKGLRGEFAGWADAARDRKLEDMAAVIGALEPKSFQVSANRKRNDEVLKPVAPRGLASLHFSLTFMVVSSLARYMASIGSSMPMEFVFDQQEGVSTDVGLFFDFMRGNIPKDANRLILGDPTYASDKDVPGLQAADMLVWHLRREHECHISGTAPLPMAERLRASDHLVVELPDEATDRFAAYFSRFSSTLAKLQGRGRWNKFRDELRMIQDAGYRPPHAPRWVMAVHLYCFFVVKRMAARFRHAARQPPDI